MTTVAAKCLEHVDILPLCLFSERRRMDVCFQ